MTNNTINYTNIDTNKKGYNYVMDNGIMVQICDYKNQDKSIIIFDYIM